MKVVAIGGSPRLDGNTNYLLDRILDALASRGIATEKIILSELRVNPCQGHHNCSAFPECQDIFRLRVCRQTGCY